MRGYGEADREREEALAEIEGMSPLDQAQHFLDQGDALSAVRALIRSARGDSGGETTEGTGREPQTAAGGGTSGITEGGSYGSRA